jgi:hypothetical protein
MRVRCNIPIDEVGAYSIRELLDTLATIWARYLAKHPLPCLYSSGIRFQKEPNAGQYEDWKPPHQTLEDGWGDCDDLVLYRVAELRSVGECAEVVVMRRRGTNKFHVAVRRGDGRLEDPSLVVMKQAVVRARNQWAKS